MAQEGLEFLDGVKSHGIWGYLWILFISLLAATSKYLNEIEGKRVTWYGWIKEAITCSFVGLIAAMTCQHYGFDFYTTTVITSIAAHSGTKSMYLMSEIIKRAK